MPSPRSGEEAARLAEIRAWWNDLQTTTDPITRRFVEDVAWLLDRLAEASSTLIRPTPDLRDVFGMNGPTPLWDVLTTLADYAEHALDAHGCDVEGYEHTRPTVAAARAYVPKVIERAASVEPAEGRCNHCGGVNPANWHAPSPLWNAVMRAEGVEEVGFCCPSCFIEVARERGIDSTAWHLSIDGIDLAALWQDADGRAWNAETCLWEASDQSGVADDPRLAVPAKNTIASVAPAEGAAPVPLRPDALDHAMELVRALPIGPTPEEWETCRFRLLAALSDTGKVATA